MTEGQPKGPLTFAGMRLGEARQIDFGYWSFSVTRYVDDTHHIIASRERPIRRTVEARGADAEEVLDTIRNQCNDLDFRDGVLPR